MLPHFANFDVRSVPVTPTLVPLSAAKSLIAWQSDSSALLDEKKSLVFLTFYGYASRECIIGPLQLQLPARYNAHPQLGRRDLAVRISCGDKSRLIHLPPWRYQ